MKSKKSKNQKKENNHNKNKKILSFVIMAFSVVFFCVLGIILGLSFYIIKQQEKLKDRIYPNVFFNGVDVGRKTKKEVISMFYKDPSKYDKVNIDIFIDDMRMSSSSSHISTISAKMLDIKFNANEIFDEAYKLGRNNNTRTRLTQQINSLLGFKKHDFSLELIYDAKVINGFVVMAEKKYNEAPLDAVFKVKNNKVIEFAMHKNGLALDMDVFRKDLKQAIKEIDLDGEDKSIIVRGKIVEPEKPLKKSNPYGIEELIGMGKSDYSGSTVNRIFNLSLATSRINGALVPKDGIFSFNKTVGKITKETGYKSGYIIKDGRSQEDDGGGVCQVPTTLFRTVLNTGLPIVERHAHAYRVGYYENDSLPGLDATIFSPSVDLKFKNDTGASILIMTEQNVNKNLLTFYIYGKKDDRVAMLSPITIWDVVPAPEAIKEDDPTLQRGQVKQIDFAALGTKSKFSYKVTKDKKVVIDTIFYSTYKPWPAVYKIGTKD